MAVSKHSITRRCTEHNDDVLDEKHNQLDTSERLLFNQNRSHLAVQNGDLIMQQPER